LRIGTRNDVEWFLRPVVALCARANRKRRLSRNLITVMIIIYIYCGQRAVLKPHMGRGSTGIRGRVVKVAGPSGFCQGAGRAQ